MHERPAISPFRPTGARQVVRASAVEDAFGVGQDAADGLYAALRARLGAARLAWRDLSPTRAGRSW